MHAGEHRVAGGLRRQPDVDAVLARPRGQQLHGQQRRLGLALTGRCLNQEQPSAVSGCLADQRLNRSAVPAEPPPHQGGRVLLGRRPEPPTQAQRRDGGPGALTRHHHGYPGGVVHAREVPLVAGDPVRHDQMADRHELAAAGRTGLRWPQVILQLVCDPDGQGALRGDPAFVAAQPRRLRLQCPPAGDPPVMTGEQRPEPLDVLNWPTGL